MCDHTIYTYPVFENLSKVNICYYTGMSIKEDIMCGCLLVVCLNVDISCVRVRYNHRFSHRHGTMAYMKIKGTSWGTRQNLM